MALMAILEVFSLCLVLLLKYDTEALNHSLLLETIRIKSSTIATNVSFRELNCEKLIYSISDDSFSNHCTDNSTYDSVVPIQFRWLSQQIDKETRCYCALSFFQLMIPFSIYNNVSFCTEDSVFTCEDDCIDLPDAMSFGESKCVVRTVEMYTSSINDINIILVGVFSGLSCEAIRDHREDICDILFDATGPATTMGNTTQETTTEDFIGPEILFATIFIGAVTFLIAIIIFIILTFCLINCRKKRLTLNKTSVKIYPSDELGRVESVSSPTDHQQQSNIYANIRFESSMLLRKDEFKITGELGQGAFGIVYKGCMHKTSTDVAIKTLKETSTGEEIQEFLSEADVMLEFDHPNVMAIIGVCVDSIDGLPLIVLPYMVNGDLKSFLISCRKDNCVETLPENLNPQRLKLICKNIANGMAYLADIKFVHRDLAARNCMVDEHLNIKVGDFGFTRDIYGQDYYRLNRKARLPIKWMSPESLLDNIYNEKTDVWSFGVTCWEIYSLGRLPYPGIENGDIPDYIQKGNILRKPFLCPQEMYSIFLTCWNINPKDRPNFEELVDIIDNLNGKDTNNDRQQQNHYFVLENNLYNTFEMQDQDLSRMSTADKSSTL